MGTPTKTDASYKGKLLRLFREIMLLTKSPFGLSIKDNRESIRSARFIDTHCSS